MDEVIDYAERKKISLTEARKSPFIKAFLQTNAETRKTAEATATGTTRKTSSKSDAETLVKKAQDGTLSPEEMRAAAKAMIEDTFGKK